MLPKIPKISCSLLAAVGKARTLEDVVRSFENLGVDMIHYDVAEVEKTLELADIQRLRQHTTLPFDVHLAVKDPIAYLDDLDLQAGDLFAAHVENELSPDTLAEIKQQHGCRIGLAIRTETPVTTLIRYAPFLDFVLFMAATPGVSGGTFDFTVVDKIEKFRRQFPAVSIHVDGGVNHITSAVLRDLAVDTLISGSYILSADESSQSVRRLLGRNLLLPINAVMRSGSDLPVVGEEATVVDVASEIQAKGIGCACVVDGRRKLVGLVTDGDLRRQLCSNSNLGGLSARDIMSRDPYVAKPEQRVLELLRDFEDGGRDFAVIPVTLDDGSCVGILRLQDVLTTVDY